MSKVNLFVLIPESNPQFGWICNNNTLALSGTIHSYLNKIQSLKDEINLEKYDGYFDKVHFMDLLDCLNLLDDCYPRPPQTKLKKLFSDFFDWREKFVHSNEIKYTIFAQTIIGHSICEIAQRIHNNSDQKYALINADAISLKKEINVTINDSHIKNVEIINEEIDLISWFSNNRIPKRNFQSIPKHDILQPIIKNNRLISPLKCKPQHAEAILKNAIGIHSKELFGYDSIIDMVIVFKYENNTPQNQYHGYHVPNDSIEIPSEINQKINLYFRS